jgi:hypothetical protein
MCIVDVGRSFTLYAEFSRSGGHYVAFPDARRHTLRLEQLRDPEIRETHPNPIITATESRTRYSAHPAR